MATLNDYKEWLQEVDINPSDYESPSALVTAIRNIEECGLFKVVMESYPLYAACLYDERRAA